MYDNSYEEYMRSVLGYPYSQGGYNTYNNIYENTNMYFPYRSGNSRNDIDTLEGEKNRYEEMYPELYRILRPMVKKVCADKFIDQISNNDVESMTEDVYRNISSDIGVVNINVTSDPGISTRGNMKTKEVPEEEKRSASENPFLRDLIKILVLNQLINNRPSRPGRPPMPPPPPRPPYNRPPRPLFRDVDDIEHPYYTNQNFPY